ncbi:hypothetical protein [Streptomyces iranensis]|uniref:hypothetical protein n=1 Tax=Streptomyces iranensis TaxID=576784 RepID=UPI0039B73201
MADARVKSDQLVGISGGFSTHMNFLVEVVNALVAALETSKGMAGDDGGGRNFAKVYQGAVREAVAQMSFSTYAMGNLSATVMEMAFDLLATENRHQPGQTAPFGQPHHRDQPGMRDQIRLVEHGRDRRSGMGRLRLADVLSICG